MAWYRFSFKEPKDNQGIIYASFDRDKWWLFIGTFYKNYEYGQWGKSEVIPLCVVTSENHYELVIDADDDDDSCWSEYPGVPFGIGSWWLEEDETAWKQQQKKEHEK